MSRVRAVIIASLILVAIGAETAQPADLVDYDWQWLNPLPQGDQVSAVTWGDEEFIAIAGSGSVMASEDGDMWSVVAQLEPDGFTDLIWTGDQYIALTAGVSSTPPRIWTSANGRTWQQRPAPAFFLNTIVSNGSRWVIVGNNGAVFYGDSLDALTQADVPRVSYQDVTWTGSQFIAIATQDTALTSPDGETWTEVSTGVEGRFRSIETIDGLSVAVASSGIIMTTTDGAAWTEGSVGNNVRIPFMAIRDETFYVAGGSQVASSTDGQNWTLSSGGLSTIASFAAGPSRFVAWTILADPRSSMNLSSWQSNCDCFEQELLLDIASNEHAGVIVGPQGRTLRFDHSGDITMVSVGAATRLQDVDWDGQAFVAVGEGGTFGTSDTGESWSITNAGTQLRLNDVVVTNAGYLAVGDDGVIVSSGDGTTWAPQVSGTSERLTAVKWSGDQYVAVGARGVVLTSPSGFTWTSRDSGSTLTLNDVAFGANRFVAVNVLGQILTSTDAVSWSATVEPANRALHQVQWTGEQFIVVGAGHILTSADGLTWAIDDKFYSVGAKALVHSANEAIVVGDYGAILHGTAPELVFSNGFE